MLSFHMVAVVGSLLDGLYDMIFNSDVFWFLEVPWLIFCAQVRQGEVEPLPIGHFG